MDKREVHKRFNTLACIPMGLIGYRITIELCNDAYVTGKLVDADAMMSIELIEAKYVDGNGEESFLQHFHVMGRKIRNIHIPDEVDVMALMQGLFQPTPKVVKRPTLREKIIMKRDQQTLKRYYRSKQQQMDD